MALAGWTRDLTSDSAAPLLFGGLAALLAIAVLGFFRAP
jgi:hypothetical protein